MKHVYNTVDYEDSDGQFCDRGNSYSPATYYKNNKQKKIINDLAPKSSKVAVENDAQEIIKTTEKKEDSKIEETLKTDEGSSEKK